MLMLIYVGGLTRTNAPGIFMNKIVYTKVDVARFLYNNPCCAFMAHYDKRQQPCIHAGRGVYLRRVVASAQPAASGSESL